MHLDVKPAPPDRELVDEVMSNLLHFCLLLKELTYRDPFLLTKICRTLKGLKQVCVISCLSFCIIWSEAALYSHVFISSGKSSS